MVALEDSNGSESQDIDGTLSRSDAHVLGSVAEGELTRGGLVRSRDILLMTSSSTIVNGKHAVAWKEMLRIKCNGLVL